MQMPTRILCPTDFSEVSLGALRFAVGLARTLGCSIDLMHVYHVPGHTSDASLPQTVAGLSPELKQELEHSLKDMVGELGSEAEGLAIELSLEVGIPYERICEHVRATGADLVVMATFGRGGLSRLLMGSVSDRVQRVSPVPVLFVK